MLITNLVGKCRCHWAFKGEATRQTENLGKLFLVGKSTLAKADTESIIARMRQGRDRFTLSSLEETYKA